LKPKNIKKAHKGAALEAFSFGDPKKELQGISDRREQIPLVDIRYEAASL
jgi:hypothetical protein